MDVYSDKIIEIKDKPLCKSSRESMAGTKSLEYSIKSIQENILIGEEFSTEVLIKNNQKEEVSLSVWSYPYSGNRKYVSKEEKENIQFLTLSSEEEKVIAEALSKKFGLNLKATLEGNRLNEIFGYVGKEQHLRRWAGDTLAGHAITQAGMAPLQGAFKDFDNVAQEKYYVAVQLHELPNWNKEWSTLKPWYKFRKVLVYNPINQKAVVAVIGDSGPSKFTGKTFGGSPEVMEYLQMEDGSQKGKAIILFVDDTQNRIALGPVDPNVNYLASQK